jgi:hypothetical protein
VGPKYRALSGIPHSSSGLITGPRVHPRIVKVGGRAGSYADSAFGLASEAARQRRMESAKLL